MRPSAILTQFSVILTPYQVIFWYIFMEHNKELHMNKIILFLSIGLLSLQAEGITLPNSFKADFINTITNTKKKIIQYSGTMKFSNKSHIKWAYKKPTKKEVCTDGHELIVVDHDLEQVSNYVITKGFDLVKILKNAKLHSKNIYTSEYTGKIVTIKVDDKKHLHSVAYFDDLDNKVQIKFNKVHYSKDEIDKKSMMCKVPKAYDIIRG